ncbi:MAG TPA: DUF308 domain-containing protein [Candidatus Eisenbergiella merdipullorum]|uniref:DUF308 domain-containing protein n=1 Tax=Candidatus Eisenbergiella merdipullorum TaxID=2838553 RepID=A0A9D2I7E9_9FIRM|nr:DUF308 domain-containing protein [Candidatus Eisenbergiella merdipullorum]
MRNRKAFGWAELILGILLCILGIYTFIHPSVGVTGATLLYGIVALVSGIIDIVFYIKLEQRTGFGPALSLVGGILSIIASLLILFNLGVGEWVLVILFPIWFIAHCIAQLAHLPFIRLMEGTGYYYFTLVINILGLLVGIFMFFTPFVSFFSVGYMIAIYLLFLGIDSVVFSLNLLS